MTKMMLIIMILLYCYNIDMVSYSNMPKGFGNSHVNFNNI